MPYKYKNRTIFKLNENTKQFGACAIHNENLKTQDFYELRDECLRENILFEDDLFPAHVSSIGPIYLPENTVWKRPTEIEGLSPEFITNGATRFDIKQGRLGDCWFLAAVATIANNEEVFNHVVPQDQGFDNKYCGIFHFRFWKLGQWIDIVIDDRLPYSNNKLIFLKSNDTNEYWSPLLEKAYAKFYGSYNSLQGGLNSEALIDLTGGISELYYLPSMSDLDISKLYDLLKDSLENNSFACTATDFQDQHNDGRQVGLPTFHAYSITHLQRLDVNTSKNPSKIDFIRIRNPWGNAVEWNGQFSDSSLSWRLISEEDKKNLNFVDKKDGEFWIMFLDFIKYFTIVEICHLPPELKKKTIWNTSLIHGQWTDENVSPIYLLKIISNNKNGDITVIIINLRRKHFRCVEVERTWEAKVELTVLTVNSIPIANEVRTFRDVAIRLNNLSSGEYYVIPKIYSENNQHEFLLRVFSTSKNEIKLHTPRNIYNK